jgi:hypothetical protein
MLIVLGAFWFESSLLAFRIYNVILPILSFAMLLWGAYAMGILALYWDLDAEEDSQPG